LLAAEPVAQYGTAVAPVRDLGEIAARIREHAAEFAAQGVVRIGVFGSFAVGEQTPASDVDLLVDYAQRPEGFAFFEAPALAERVLGRKVDWTQPHLLKDRLEPRILAEVVYVWEA
jgi:predicted nucleotidyltransferase